MSLEIRDIMVQKATTVDTNASLKEAVAIMNEHEISISFLIACKNQQMTARCVKGLNPFFPSRLFPQDKLIDISPFLKIIKNEGPRNFVFAFLERLSSSKVVCQRGGEDGIQILPRTSRLHS